MNQHRHGEEPRWRPAPGRRRTPARVLRRRGFRLILTSVIGAPLLLVFGMFAALSAGFCGDRISSEVAACESSASSTGAFIALLFLVDASLFVAGLIMRAKARQGSGHPDELRASTPPIESGTEGARASLAVALAVACWVCALTIVIDSGGWRFLCELALLSLVPATFVVAWGADSERRHEIDGRHSSRAIAAAGATLLCLLYLMVV